MLKGQEGNILPFVITCCSSIALVEWGTPGGFGQSVPFQIGMRPSMCQLPSHLHISLRHTDTTPPAGLPPDGLHSKTLLVCMNRRSAFPRNPFVWANQTFSGQPVHNKVLLHLSFTELERYRSG